MPKKVLLLVGTKRGLFMLRSAAARRSFEVEGPMISGDPVFCAAADLRGKPALFAGVNSSHWGPSIHRSLDMGKTWRPAKVQPRFKRGSGRTVEQIWQIEPDISAPGRLFAGTAPAALFRSEDAGETWAEVDSLSRHPTRKRWQPGGGGLCLHTIL